ncbi:MAG TPA: hypothetical protein VIF15_13405 [Polyangiaceae bacterium]
MDGEATLVWVAPEPPDAEQSRALASWARAHGVRLVSPVEARSVGALPPADGHLADEVEKLLERARDAIAARDGEAVDRALSAAESELRAHPELPQAAWLMAEVDRTRSTRFRRVPPLDPEAAERAWARAEALDGGRATGVGEEPAVAHAPAATLAFEGAPADTQTWLDGAPVREGAVATRAGPHVVAATRDGATVWAAWIEVPAGSSSVHVAAPAAPLCSARDVAGARLAGDAVEGDHVRCGAWVAAVGGAVPGTVRVATCEAGRCGPLLEWRAWQPPSWTWTPGHDRGKGWPAWATWGLVGAGAVVAASIVLVASGALQPAPTETRFVSGGIKSQ